ncbi:MAG: hypothetical protein PGN25_06790 [Methylorubrum populi]
MPDAVHRSGPGPARFDRLTLGSGPVLGTILTLAVALAFAWWGPVQNRWPALALVLALALDNAARVAARAVRRRTGVETEIRGLPSPMPALGGAPWIGAALVAAGSGFRPDLFPLLACALAGLIAMGACARLALARMVVAIEAAERAAAEAETRGEGTGR